MNVIFTSDQELRWRNYTNYVERMVRNQTYGCYESYKSSIWISEQKLSIHLHLHLQALKFDFACLEEHIKVKLSIIISYTTICILPWNDNYGAWFCASINILYTYIYIHVYSVLSHVQYVLLVVEHRKK